MAGVTFNDLALPSTSDRTPTTPGGTLQFLFRAENRSRGVGSRKVGSKDVILLKNHVGGLCTLFVRSSSFSTSRSFSNFLQEIEDENEGEGKVGGSSALPLFQRKGVFSGIEYLDPSTCSDLEC